MAIGDKFVRQVDNLGWVSLTYLVGISEAQNPLQAKPPNVSQTPAVTPTTPADRPVLSPGLLNSSIVEKMNASSIKNQYRYESELFVDGLLQHADEFQLPGENITPASLNTILSQPDTGDRINALVHRVWKDWSEYGVNHLADDPGANGQSPFRQLVIRLAQGRQGPLSPSDQRALYSFFSRNEDPDVWSNEIRGVIGAINLEFYGY